MSDITSPEERNLPDQEKQKWPPYTVTKEDEIIHVQSAHSEWRIETKPGFIPGKESVVNYQVRAAYTTVDELSPLREHMGDFCVVSWQVADGDVVNRRVAVTTDPVKIGVLCSPYEFIRKARDLHELGIRLGQVPLEWTDRRTDSEGYNSGLTWNKVIGDIASYGGSGSSGEDLVTPFREAGIPQFRDLLTKMRAVRTEG